MNITATKTPSTPGPSQPTCGIGILTLVLLLGLSLPVASEPLLASRYQGGLHLADWWVSEKLDGVRAHWDGRRLISRQGHVFAAPAWYTRDFPATPLDGELWMGRGRFEATVSAVRRQQPDDAAWRQVRFMVFDLPAASGSFTRRLSRLRTLIAAAGVPWLQAVKQFHVADEHALMARLKQVTEAGGEGLILHRGASHQRSGRSRDLLKLKPWWDAEATVVAHIPGKGRLAGMLGALQVRDGEGRLFRIGTGFSDAERRQPPPVGSVVTYRYRGLTRTGLPRFASFLRIRPVLREGVNNASARADVRDPAPRPGVHRH